jgi:hypothetical protein
VRSTIRADLLGRRKLVDYLAVLAGRSLDEPAEAGDDGRRGRARTVARRHFLPRTQLRYLVAPGAEFDVEPVRVVHWQLVEQDSGRRTR